MFAVEEEGKEKLTADEEQRRKEEFQGKLLARLRKSKLSQLEDLSHAFKLTTREVVV